MSSLFGIDFPPCSCAMILYAREVRRRQEAVCYMVRPATQNARRMVAKPKKMGHRFYRYPIDFIVVRPAGIEPAAYCLGGNRSIRLSYERASYLVKQSDARCQVEAGGRKVLYFRG